jgi:membrane-associated protease RseP (regulator of RpoE activity)
MQQQEHSGSRFPVHWSGPPEADAPFVLRPAHAELVMLAPAHPTPVSRSASRHRWWVVPLVLFLFTCATTFLMGGPAYAAFLMLILGAHELGHYFQARRYRVPVSLPYFLPMPLPPFGTLGAFIKMKPGAADRRALFDIAIAGPLAGLVPTLLFSIIGLQLSTTTEFADTTGRLVFGRPLLFELLTNLTFGHVPRGQLALHPMAFAGWVGIFITALNLIPIGQLDGGHVLYALIGRKAHAIAVVLLVAAAAAITWLQYWNWSLMILLLVLMGPKHPPTADDRVPLGTGRIVLGWILLLFVIVGLTPTPILFPR